MEDFKRWLIKAKGLSEKSSRDVVSRLKRVQRIHSFKSGDKENKILNALAECDEFNNLSMFIRSQLRRSVRLYKEFQAKE